MRYLIAGCGYVGEALGQQLARFGHEVWGLRRSPQPGASPISWLTADLTQSLRGRLPERLDYVVYAASADKMAPEAYQAAYCRGLERVLQALTKQRQIRRVLFVSSTAVYGQSDGSWVDEGSPTEPRHFSGQCTLKAESILHNGHWPSTALRCAGIYGPGRRRLIAKALEGRLEMPKEPRLTNRVHRDDIVGAISHLTAARRNSAAPEMPRTLLLCDDEPVAQHEVLSFIAEKLDVRLAVSEHAAAPPQRGGNKRCRNGRLKALGYRLRYPTFREGYAALCRAEAGRSR